MHVFRSDKRCYSDALVPALRITLLSGLLLWGIYESVYGLFQVLGWRSSRHALYALTGHFQNPGPFGGFIACVMAAAGAWLVGAGPGKGVFRANPRIQQPGWHRKGLESMPGVLSAVSRMTTVIAWVAVATGFLVLPASMSRAGWLGLAVAMGIGALRQSQTRDWLKMNRWALPAGCAIIVALFVGAFLLKPDSALGRVHVWRMECRAIAERPWTGAGPGMGPWAYGEAQECFFREHLETVSPATVRVAGCPEYAYNEYLGLGVEYGVPAIVLSIVLVVSGIVVLHRAQSPLSAGLTAWAIFACASYPLAVPQLRILGAIFILGAIVAGVLQTADRLGGMSEAKFRRGNCLRLAGLLPIVSLALLLGWMCFGGLRIKSGMTVKGMPGKVEREKYRELYSEGYALHQMGRYEESTKVLKEGVRMSCDPMFEIIMGKNAEAQGDCEKAASLYEKAHYMVPSRLYPLVRLMRLQVRQGRDEDALATAQQIVSMPVNGKNAGMVRLQDETRRTLDSLAAIVTRGMRGELEVVDGQKDNETSSPLAGDKINR